MRKVCGIDKSTGAIYTFLQIDNWQVSLKSKRRSVRIHKCPNKTEVVVAFVQAKKKRFYTWVESFIKHILVIVAQNNGHVLQLYIENLYIIYNVPLNWVRIPSKICHAMHVLCIYIIVINSEENSDLYDATIRDAKIYIYMYIFLTLLSQYLRFLFEWKNPQSVQIENMHFIYSMQQSKTFSKIKGANQQTICNKTVSSKCAVWFCFFGFIDVCVCTTPLGIFTQ